MRAAWYERRGKPTDVLVVGETKAPIPAANEVRIRVAVSGISPGDVKKRAGVGEPMPYPRVIPHSDGAGVIDLVGAGVSAARLGERAWCFHAQSYRPFGTAAEYTVVPTEQAIPLPEAVSDDTGACLGIAGITAHRAVFADGPLTGKTVLVSGALGGVGSIALQLARWGGAHVIGTVRHAADAERVRELGAHHAFAAADGDLAEKIAAVAPGGVDRIAEVDFAGNIALDAQVLAVGGTVASYASASPMPQLPYWTLGFADATLRLLGSDDFPAAAAQDAARDLTACAAAGAMAIPISARFTLDDIAAAHQAVEDGPGGRVVVTPG
ncbi:MAG: hypothetical protein JWR63_1331 [Conexibacter sp.]|nr:hypothetical protein [Conexibacter sp.]